MGQPQAIGIDDTITARDWLKSPWSRKAALRHTSRISCAAAGGPSALGSFRRVESGLDGLVRVLSHVDTEVWRD
jgi:hypothetical protein